MSDIFFFTEVDSLSSQDAPKAFGPMSSSSGSDKFRVTSLHSSSGTSSAYAVCNGMVCVQQDTSNSLLVNLILKPHDQSNPYFPAIKYFIYRGILKSSLFDASGDILSSGNNLLDSIDNSWQAYLTITSQSTTPAPKEILGINLVSTITDFANTDPVDHLFSKNLGDYQFPNVQGGWELGTFSSTQFGFEIVLDKANYEPALTICRSSMNEISVTQLGASPNQLELFEHWHAKDEILSYIDPAAYFGSFYTSKIYIKETSIAFAKCKDNSIYDKILKGEQHTVAVDGNYYNRNKTYVYIRNEHNQSLNYYRNYGDDIKIAFSDGGALQQATYYQNDWPVYIIANSQYASGNDEEKNDLLISFPVGDNPSPVAVVIHGYVKRRKPFRKLTGRKRFFALDGSGTYTDEIHLQTPNRDSLGVTTSICSVVILSYSKELSLETAEAVSTGYKIESNYYFDNVFSPVRLNSILSNSGSKFTKIFKEDVYVHRPDTGKQFIANTGFAKDDTGVYFLMYAMDRKNLFGFKQRKFFSFVSEQEMSSSNFINKLESTFQDFSLEQSNVNYQTEDIQLINIDDSYSNFLNRFSYNDPEELFVMYLTSTEFSSLQTLVATNNLDTTYNISLGFTNREVVYDIDDKEFINYDLVLKGYVTGTNIINAIEISTNIKIYQYVS